MKYLNKHVLKNLPGAGLPGGHKKSSPGKSDELNMLTMLCNIKLYSDLSLPVFIQDGVGTFLQVSSL